MRGSEGYQDNILESITDAFFALDEHWRFTYLNSEAERVLFRGRQDLLGKNVWEEFPEAVGLAFYREYHRAVSERITVEFEDYFAPLQTWFEVRAYPHEGGLAVYFRDINERKRMEHELAEGERRLGEVLVQHSSEVITILEEDGTIRYQSPAVKKVLGYGPEERVGEDVFLYIHTEDREEVRRVFSEVLGGAGSEVRVEFRFRHADGSWRRLDAVGSNLLEESGVRGVVVNSRDVTERRAVEERHRAVVDTASDAIITMSAEGEVRSFNAGAERIFGYAADEVVGQPLAMLMPERFREAHEQGFARYLRTGEARVIGGGAVELAGLRKGGEEFPVDLSLAESRGEDERLFVGIIRDVTRRKRDEEEILRLNEELEERVERRTAELEAALARQERSVARESALRGASAALVAAPDRERIYAAALEAILPFMDEAAGTRVSIWTGSSEKDLCVGASGDRASEIEGKETYIREFPDWVRVPLIEGRAVEVAPREADAFRDAFRFETKLGTLFMVPLFVRGRFKGRIVVVSDSSLPEEIRYVLEALGLQVALALERADLMDDLHERQGEERFRALIQNSSDIIMILDKNRNVTYVSPTIERVLGRNAAGGILAFVHFDDVARVRSFLDDLLRSPDGVSSTELRVRHADGSWRHIEWRGNNLLDDPAVGGIVINARDVTGRKRDEEALRESEERNRLILTAIPDMMFRVSPEGEYLDCWANHDHKLYVPREQLVGRKLHEVLPSELADQSIQGVDRALRTGDMQLIEYQLPVPEGLLDFELRLVPSETEEVLGLVRDITGRKRNEAALQESERRLNEAQALAAVGNWEWEVATDTVTWSEQQYRNFGLDSEEFGASFEAFMGHVHADDYAYMVRVTDSSLREPGPFEWEYRMVRPDGEVRYMHTRGRTFTDEAGEPVRLVGADHDITERRKNEEIIQRERSLLRTVIDSAQDFIFVKDREHRFLLNNAAHQRILGVASQEDLLGKTNAEYWGEGAAPFHADDRRVIDAGEEIVGKEEFVPGPSGEKRWLSTTKVPLRGPDGEIGGLVAVSRDVTGRKRAEEAAAEELLKSELRAAVGEALNRGGSVSDVLQRCTDAMVERVEEVSFARAWTLDEDGDQLELEANSGGGVDPPPLRKSASVLVREVERTRRPFVVDDISAEKRLLTRHWARGEGMNSIAGYPLVVEGALVGLITTLSPAPFPARAIEAVEAMLGPISQGIRRKWAEEELRRSEERFRGLFEQSAVGITIATPDRVFQETNRAFQEMTGYSERELAGRPIADISDPDDVLLDIELAGRVSSGELDRYQREKRYVRSDGTTIWVKPTVTAVRGGDGEVEFFVGMVEDITGRKRMQEQLEASEELSRSAFENTPLGIVLVDLDGRFMQVNRAICEILGYSEEELLSKSFQEITHPEDLDTSVDLRRAFIDGGVETASFEKRYLCADGEAVWVAVYINVVKDSWHGRPFYFVTQIQDITERKRLEAELEHRALHDPLTGLANRNLFTERLEQALPRAARSGKALATLFLDLDNFKFINDSLSHDVGDQLLVQVAARLGSCLRQTDTAARMGGDEFTVLVEEISGEGGAVMVADRIAEALREPFHIDGREVFVTFSIGIAVSLDAAGEPSELLRDADTAMYRAKNGGKAQYEIFDQSMNTRALQRLELEGDLRRAVEHGEIEVHYQPRVRLDTGEVCGAEALARWEHPERGFVSPEEFIPVAEETGLILPLGRSMLAQACRQTKQWQDSYPDAPPLAVSVNLSAKQFQSHDLTDDIQSALRESGLAPSDLTLELTESAMMDDTDANAEVLGRLKELGVVLALDDFGTGYSSLSYLRRLPVDVLKIDRYFVGGVGEEAGDMAIVSAVLTFARTLGLSVVAEGVETAEQLASLRGLGCELAQGYYFARPLPPAQMEALLRAGEPLADPRDAESTKAFGHFAENHKAAEKSHVLNRAIASSRDAVVITDPDQPDNPLIYVNHSFERLTGYTAGESVGHNCRFLRGGDDDQPALEELRAALAAGAEWVGVLRNYRKDGTMFYNELSISPVHDSGGNLLSFIGVQNDVTERAVGGQTSAHSKPRGPSPDKKSG